MAKTLLVFGIDFESYLATDVKLKNREIMKTIKYIAGLLMMVAISISSASGQGSAQRSTAQRGSVQRVSTKSAVKQEQKKPSDRQISSQQRTTVQRSSTQRSSVKRSTPERSQVQRQPQRSSADSRHHVAQRNENANISTRNNPRSGYRDPVYIPPANRNRYSDKPYYGGRHYHPMYPTGRVNMHYHHDTYVHNYRVLYRPVHVDIYWSRNMYRDYCRWYPNYHWRYHYGYRIKTLSVFDAKYNLGEVAMVYGRVYASWYNQETDDYLLFFGGDYPYQQFTVVLPGHIARRFSWKPERFFLGEHLTVTGLITTFEGIPEIIVKDKRQIGIY